MKCSLSLHPAFPRQADALVCAKRVNILQGELSSKMKVLRETVRGKAAVHTAQVFVSVWVTVSMKTHFFSFFFFLIKLQNKCMPRLSKMTVIANMHAWVLSAKYWFCACPTGNLKLLLEELLKGTGWTELVPVCNSTWH